ncbi:MAG: YkgJ family cysteine cluster protein [Spirochaetes bacterium]|nr:YkgJ family cysteine cluster protein [Spirochaetota bacterium]
MNPDLGRATIPSRECARCGNCCRSDMIAYVTDGDMKRWTGENRLDILQSIENSERIWAGDRIIDSRGRRLETCSFLRAGDSGHYCGIYGTRPDICRNFMPASSELCPLYGKTAI